MFKNTKFFIKYTLFMLSARRSTSKLPILNIIRIKDMVSTSFILTGQYLMLEVIDS